MENFVENIAENMLVVQMFCESIISENIWSASHKMKGIIAKLTKNKNERNYLEGFALRLLLKKFLLRS